MPAGHPESAVHGVESQKLRGQRIGFFPRDLALCHDREHGLCARALVRGDIERKLIGGDKMQRLAHQASSAIR